MNLHSFAIQVVSGPSARPRGLGLLVILTAHGASVEFENVLSSRPLRGSLCQLFQGWACIGLRLSKSAFVLWGSRTAGTRGWPCPAAFPVSLACVCRVSPVQEAEEVPGLGHHTPHALLVPSSAEASADLAGGEDFGQRRVLGTPAPQNRNRTESPVVAL